MFTGGVDTSYRRTARTSSAPGLDAALESPRPGADEDPASVPTDGAVARLKAHLLWRDEATEREWEQETGWNLLTCACLLDDYAAAMMLLAAPDGRSLVNAYGRAHRHAMRTEPDIPAHHRTPLAQQLFGLAHEHMPLIGAMSYSRPALVRALLEANAKVPPHMALDIICGSPFDAPLGALINGRIDNVEVYLSFRGDHVDIATLEGTRCAMYSQSKPLHIASCMEGSSGDMLRVVRWLLAHGAAKTLSTRTVSGLSPVHMLATNPSPEAVIIMRELYEAGHLRSEHLNAHESQALASVGMWGISRLAARLGDRTSKEGLVIQEMLDIGGRSTVLHRAVDTGSIEMCELLLEIGADPAAVDARGRTPLQRAKVNLDAAHSALLGPRLADATPPQRSPTRAIVNAARGFGRALCMPLAVPVAVNFMLRAMSENGNGSTKQGQNERRFRNLHYGGISGGTDTAKKMSISKARRAPSEVTSTARAPVRV